MQTVKKEDILKVLNAVKIGVGSGDTVESMQYFYFTGNEVVGYNELRSVRTNFKSEFKGFVKAMDLMNIVSKISSDEIELSMEKEKFTIKSGKFKIKLNTINDKELIKLIKVINKDTEKLKFKALDNDFTEGLVLCEPFCSRNEVDETLTCVNVNGHMLEAGDNRRIARMKVKQKFEQFFVPYKEIKVLADFNPTEFALTKKWIHFKNEDKSMYSIKRIVGEFPDFSPLVKSDQKKIDFPEELKEAVDIATLLTDDQLGVKISIADGKCTSELKTNSGKMKHISKIDSKDKVAFRINPIFFTMMLEQSTTFQIESNRIITTAENFTIVSALIGIE